MTHPQIDPFVDDAPDSDEDDGLPLGASSVLTEEGWEAVEYIEPGPDWRLQADGSFVSPDGRTQSRPLVNPSPLDL
jgi:hypothetical protein